MTDTPNLIGANEFDGVDDDDNGQKNFFQEHPWFSLLGLIALAVFSVWAYSIWNFERQLPAPFTAVKGDTLIAHVTSTEDPVKRLQIAIWAAERTEQPIRVVQRCGAARAVVPVHECGKPYRTWDYNWARKYARFSDSVLFDVPLQPGAFMDARRGKFTPAPRRVNVVDPVVVIAPTR